jgi:hypothetical protein
MSLNAIANEQANPNTKGTKEHVLHLLNYLATHPHAFARFMLRT